MILGTKDVTKMLKNASELEISKAVSKGIKLVQSAARAECPVDHGELRGSIFTVVEAEGRNVTGICYTDKKYGPYVEFGTGLKGQANHEAYRRMQRRFIHNRLGGSTKAVAGTRLTGRLQKNAAGSTLTHRRADSISVPDRQRSLLCIRH